MSDPHQEELEQPISTPEDSSPKVLALASQVVDERAEKLPEAKKSLFTKITQNTQMASAALIMAIIINAGCSNIPVTTPTATPVRQSVTSNIQPTPTEIPIPENIYAFNSGIQIAVDKDGIPLRYILPNGQVVNLDKFQMTKLRSEAILNKRNSIIDVIQNTAPQQKPPFQPSSEKPRVMQLPKDVVSTDELSQRGIRIIQGDKTQLYIRSSAFKTGGILEKYQKDLSKDTYSSRGLYIVLVDGPVVSPEYLKDKKYDNVRTLEKIAKALPQPKTKAELAEKYNQKRGEITQQINSEQPNTPKNIKQLQEKLLALDIKIKILETLPPDQLQAYLLAGGSIETGHYYSAFVNENDPQGRRINDIIFLAFGKEIVTTAGNVLYFNPSGEVRVGNFNWDIGINSLPRPEFTHPNPSKEYTMSGDSEADYPVDSGNNPTNVLYHELAHLMGVRVERLASLEAYRKEQEQYDKWEGSGFKEDNNPFMFSIPPENGGGFISVENQDSSDKPASV